MNKNNRWIVLIAGCIIQTILGGIYAWSTFIPYLIKDYHLSSGQCGLIFGTTILVFTTAMIYAGRLMVKKGPRFTAQIAAVLYSIGYLFASFSGGSFFLLMLFLGGIVGCGIGFGYVCPLSVGMKWFPDKKGLVTGVSVAGFGAGAILVSSIAEHFLSHDVNVLSYLRWSGILSGLILWGCATLLKEPPATKATTTKSFNNAVIFTWPFYLCVIGIFAGTFGGLLIIGNLTQIILAAGSGITEPQAVLSISFFAIGNGLGRITWGKLFDYFHYRCIPLLLGSFAVVTIILLVPAPYWLLMISVILTGFCFGGNFVIYASAITKYFGIDSFPRLYPICFLAYGIAGVIGPGLGGTLADKTGTYNTSIFICIAIVSLACFFISKRLDAFNKPAVKVQKKRSMEIFCQ